MLKRLIIAVFVMGLILSFSGTAFSGDSRPGGTVDLRTPNLSAPHYNEAITITRPQPSQRIDLSNPSEGYHALSSLSKPVLPPSGYFCDAIDNSGAVDGYFTIPNGAGTRLAMAERFTVEPGVRCTIKSADVLSYGPGITGTPDMRVYLYDDDGFGFPGVILDSFTVTNATLVGAGFGFVGGSFPGTWVFENMESYHIGIVRIGTGQLGIISDDGVTGPQSGNETCNAYYSTIPGWASTLTLFAVDYALTIIANRCCADIPFTDCYTQSYWANAGLATLTVPSNAGSRPEVSTRFSVSGPETLKSVDLWVFGAIGGADVRATVYNDVAGIPGGPALATVTILNGALTFFPTPQNIDFSSFNLVFENDFHVVIDVPGAIPAVKRIQLVVDNGTSASGRTYLTQPSFVWFTSFAYFGLDRALLMDANMCNDEFSLCTNNNTHWDANNAGLSLPRQDLGLFQQGQMFNSAGEDCQVRTVELYLGYLTADAARAPKMYQRNTKVSIYNDAAGFPGANLGTISLTPADYAAAGNTGYAGVSYFWKHTINFEPLDIHIVGNYYVILESDAMVRDSGIRMGLDVDGNPPNLPGVLNSALVPGWIEVGNFYGGTTVDASFPINAKQCCIPFSEYTCLTAQDWSTPAGNYQRTGRTDVSLSDAYCDLNFRWYYEHPTQLTVFSGPIVYKGRLAQVWSGTFTQFNLLTGAINWSNTGAPNLGTNMRCTPTAATLGGVDVVFTSGGNAQSVTKWNWLTGAVMWNRPGPNGSGGGAARYGVFSIATQGPDDVLYTVSETGKVVAINAATGANYAGWGTNPVSLSAGASEVTNTYNPNDNLLYVGQSPASGNGDVVALNAATGALVWQLSTAGPGLRASVLYSGAAAATAEIFPAHVSYEAGFLYANSAMNVAAGAQFPADGIYYKVNALTGAIVHASISQRLRRGTPVVDQNNVIIPSFSVWVGGSLGVNILAFSKAFGVQTWGTAQQADAGYWMPAILTCEPGGAPDQLYAFSDDGFMSAYNANTGAEEWRRRTEYAQVGGTPSVNTRGFGLALSKDGELAVTNEWGGVAVLAKGGDRARMQFISYNMGGGVNFGTNPALPLNLGWFMKNTGCMPLNIQATAVDAASPTGQGIPTFAVPEVVGDDLVHASAVIAAKMTENGSIDKFVSLSDVRESNVESFDKTSRRETLNRAALSAPPAWFVSLDDPGAGDVIAPGDSVELKITVNQNFITRGPNIAFLTYTSNDEDFFLNDTTLDPEAKINLVGGCLTDTTDLHFGMGAANYYHVYNMGRLGEGDNTPAHGWHIDGTAGDAQYYQGSYIYSVTAKRWAANSPDWTGSTTLEWFSLQADPNWCDTTCHPKLVSPYPVPAISTNGLVYTPITASMVCRNYLDSVQFFDLGAGWSVENEPAPFDNDSTMGLYVKSRVIGATNEAGLANVTIDLMDVNERNGNSVPNWYFGSYNDYDIGAGDTSGLDKSVSTAYAWNKAVSTGIWGQIKLPFGCGQTPIINTHGLQGAQALYTPDQYFDSQYVHMTRVAAHTSQPTTGGDFEQHNTFVKNDFTPNQTISFGVAHFGFPTGAHGGSGNTANATVKTLANLVNKWTGWGRGDVNNDNVINLADIVYLAGNVNFGGPGAIPFAHLADVNASGGAANQADVDYLINFYFSCGPCPAGAWTM